MTASPALSGGTPRHTRDFAQGSPARTTGPTHSRAPHSNTQNPKQQLLAGPALGAPRPATLKRTHSREGEEPGAVCSQGTG